MQPQETREYRFDNLKAVLIFLVVFGHVLELMLWRRPFVAYTFIYLFHMPLFVFCSGYFAKYNPKKILTKLIGAYVIFQFLYILFSRTVLGNRDLPFQFSTPYWIMWYLLALIVWTLFLPMIDVVTNSKRNLIITVSASLVLGIVAGFDDTLGYTMSLSRIVYFFPFFLIGFCIKKAVSPESFRGFLSKWTIKAAAGALSIGILVWLFFYNQTVDVRWLWGAFSYERIGYSGYTFVTRILLYLVALVTSLFLLSIMPRKKLFFSYIGRQTLPIFLLHGFVIRLLFHFNVPRHIPDGFGMTLFALAVTAVTVAVFSIGGLLRRGTKQNLPSSSE